MRVDNDTQNTLECLIDHHGLADVLDAIANVCTDKAEHLASNWQDVRSARVWERRATRLRKVVSGSLEG